MKMQKKKRRIREQILSILFAEEFHDDRDSQGSSTTLLPSGLSTEGLSSESQKTQDYVQQTVWGIKKNKMDIDKLIEQSSHSWKMKRISLIDLNIMRLALYEIFYASPPLPFKVCVDEALEIAKLYSSKDSTAFINGNLDAIYKNKVSS